MPAHACHALWAIGEIRDKVDTGSQDESRDENRDKSRDKNRNKSRNKSRAKSRHQAMGPTSLTITFAQKPTIIPNRSVSACCNKTESEEAQEHTNSDPELPEHDEGTSNLDWGHFGRINRDGCVLGSSSDTQYEAGCKEALPSWLGKSWTNRRRYQTASHDKDLTSSLSSGMFWKPGFPRATRAARPMRSASWESPWDSA